MLKDTMTIDQEQLDVYAFNTIVVGSGAAGLNAAARLSDLGVDVALSIPIFQPDPSFYFFNLFILIGD